MLWWPMKMLTVDNSADQKSNQTNSKGEASVITKFELIVHARRAGAPWTASNSFEYGYTSKDHGDLAKLATNDYLKIILIVHLSQFSPFHTETPMPTPHQPH